MGRIYEEISHGLYAHLIGRYRRNEVTPFILLGRKRSGTNMIRFILNQSEQIQVLGEVFNSDTESNYDFPGFFFEQRIWDLLLNNSTTKNTLLQLQRALTPTTSRQTAVGLKLMIFHPKEQWPHLFQNLIEENLKTVIMLRNPVETLISKEIALKSEVWFNKKIENIPPFAIEQFRYKEYFEQEVYIRRFIISKLPNRLEIDYSDLVNEPSMQIERVCDFLQVDQFPFNIRTTKQIQVTYEQIVENYQEIVAFYNSTIK